MTGLALVVSQQKAVGTLADDLGLVLVDRLIKTTDSGDLELNVAGN